MITLELHILTILKNMYTTLYINAYRVESHRFDVTTIPHGNFSI